MIQLPAGWPHLRFLLALLVLLATLVIAFVGSVKVENADLWLIGGLALALLLP